MLKDAVSTGLKANDSLSIALFGYDIHELLLHDDDAANRKVTHKLLDVRIGRLPFYYLGARGVCDCE